MNTSKKFLFQLLLGFACLFSAWSANGISYTYDSLNRLTKADYGAGVEISYTYDAAGNRLTYSDIDTTPYVDTTVVAWGTNPNGQTNIPAGLNNVIAVAAQYNHNLALRADGTVVAWGENTYGQTTVPASVTNIIAVATGGSHSLALRADGTVTAWGSYHNGSGFVPMTVPVGLSNVVAIAGGGDHSLALRADGTVIAWGYNSSGQVSVPAGLNNVIAVAAGYGHSLALRADGTVIAWGLSNSGQINVPAGLNNVTAVAAGQFHNLALRSDGTVAAWGSNGSGQTNVTPGLTSVIAVSAGSAHSLALRADGAVVSWGAVALAAPANLSNAVALAAGGYHSLALLGNSAPILKSSLVAQTAIAGATVTFRANVTASLPCYFQWQMNGTNLPGATGSSLVVSNVAMSQAGNYSVIASNSLGTVTSSALLTTVPLIITNQPQSQHVVVSGTTSFTVGCESVLPLTYQWRLRGTNLPGATSSTLVLTNVNLTQDGGYTVVVSNSAGSVLSAKGALTVDYLAAWGVGNPYLIQSNVPVGLSNVVAVAGGQFHNLALRGDGTVVTWGGWPMGFPNPLEQGIINTPTNLSNVVAAVAGATHSLALRADGTVVTWGAYWQLNVFVGTATVPMGLTNVVAVAAGDNHSLALRSDGTVVAWGGNNPYGQTTVPSGLNNVVAVAAGSRHSLALRADGAIVAWGDFQFGQTAIPANASNVVAIATGQFRNLALRADGTVVTWGNGANSVPLSATNIVAVATSDTSLSLALRVDGSLIEWDNIGIAHTTVPAIQLPIVAITCGSVFVTPSQNLAIPALGPPFITSRLANRTVPVGGRVYFRVEATGEWPLHYQWRRNGVALPGHTNAMLTLTGVTANDAGDYSVIVSNSLGVATIPSANLVVKFVAVQTALDNSLPWNTDSSSTGWFSQTTTTHDGVDAAQSGVIGHNQESWLESSVVGPGTLTYWWKVSSEPDYDYLEFYLDGQLQTNYISGEVPWTQQIHSITTGPHTLRWSYTKDISDSFGQDAAWLDQVSFAPPATPPQFSGSLSVSNGVFNLQLTGSSGANVIIESSFNLTTWSPLQTNTLPVGGLNLAIPVGTNQQRFFRARIP